MCLYIHRVFQVPPVIRVFQARMEKQEYKDILVRREWLAIEASEDFREKEDLLDLQDLWDLEEKPEHKALTVSLYVLYFDFERSYYLEMRSKLSMKCTMYHLSLLLT